MSEPRPPSEEKDIETRRKQVVAQYRVVAHLAKAIAEVHEQVARLYERGFGDQMLDMLGLDTHARMEILGDILNNMDSVDDDKDAWVAPIFEKAREMFPLPGDAS